jgi:signal transduction histidine kinase
VIAELPSEVPRGTRLLSVVLAGIIAVFVVTNLVVSHHTRLMQAKNRHIATNLIASIELVGRMGRDVAQERVLIETHIYETERADMVPIERRLDAIRADRAEAARAYEPLTTLPGEREAWERVKSGLVETEPVMAQALEFSRKNADQEAREIMFANAARFDDLDRTMVALMNLNHASAEQAQAEIRRIQSSQVRFVFGITLVGAVLSAVAAFWATHIVRHREEASLRLSRKIEERNRDLDAFAGRVAHDLRGPLTAVSLAGAQLANDDPESAAVAILRRGVARMETLIEDLLTLARIDRNAANAVCDAIEVVEAVRPELEARVKGYDGRLTIELEPAVIRCTPGLLEQALANLGDNAVKYRRAGVPPVIEIRGAVRGSGYVYSFRDNGIGMARHDAERAFEAFFRADRTRELPGTGLGLSIVRRIVEVHGGSVSVDSKVDCGTTFTIRLPLARRGN